MGETPAQPQFRVGHLRRVVIAAGVHGSASTWVFNVLRELLEASAGPSAVCPVYSESWEEALFAADAGQILLWKTHWGGPQVEGFAGATNALTILSIRDPRDAVLSLAERFNEPLERIVPTIERDCAFALTLSRAGAGVLRYEDRFFEQPNAVTALALRLGVAAPPELCTRIFNDWSTEAVRGRAAHLPELPAGRWIDQGAVGGLDRLTQVHVGHIGDAVAGKWRDRMDRATARAITLRLYDYILAFGYPTW